MKTDVLTSDEKKNHYIARLEILLKGYRHLAGRCCQCGGAETAYKGAVYCGAGCCARSEGHEPLGFEDLEVGTRR
jgi:uncharacterized Zn finger protein (UPF0148 family)